MTWYKVDDQYPEHPKFAALSGNAEQLWHRGLAYASRNLTDGHVPTAMLSRLTGQRYPARAAAELVAGGLWTEVDDGWTIHDYTDHQRTRAQVEADREAAAERARAARARRASRRDAARSEAADTADLHPEQTPRGSGTDRERIGNGPGENSEQTPTGSGALHPTGTEGPEPLTKPAQTAPASRRDTSARHAEVTQQETETETETEKTTPPSSGESQKGPRLTVVAGGADQQHRGSRVAQTIALLADSEMARAIAAGRDIGDHRKYLDSIIARIRRESSADLHHLAHEHPNADARQLADLHNGVQLRTTTPADQSTLLAALDKRPRDGACTTCLGRGFGIDDELKRVDCPDCQPAPTPA